MNKCRNPRAGHTSGVSENALWMSQRRVTRAPILDSNVSLFLKTTSLSLFLLSCWVLAAAHSTINLCSLCVHTANSPVGGGETARAASCPRVEATKEEREEGGKEGGSRGYCPLSRPRAPLGRGRGDPRGVTALPPGALRPAAQTATAAGPAAPSRASRRRGLNSTRRSPARRSHTKEALGPARERRGPARGQAQEERRRGGRLGGRMRAAEDLTLLGNSWKWLPPQPRRGLRTWGGRSPPLGC